MSDPSDAASSSGLPVPGASPIGSHTPPTGRATSGSSPNVFGSGWTTLDARSSSSAQNADDDTATDPYSATPSSRSWYANSESNAPASVSAPIASPSGDT